MPVSIARRAAPPEPVVRLVACPHPFSVERIERSLRAGMTIAEMLVASDLGWLLEPRRPINVRVLIDDWEVSPALWRVVRPKPGRLLTLRVVPMGGGGKNPIRIILAVVIIVVSVYFGQLYGAEVGAALLGAESAAATALGTALVTTAISLAGTLALNALIPPPRPTLGTLSGRGASDRISPALSITGSQNRANPYGPVPRMYGRHRLFPTFAAVPYSEIIGADVYHRLLFDCGFGPLELSDFRIGTTPIGFFEGVEMEVRQGFDDDPPITLYANTIREDGYSIELRQDSGPRSIESRDDADEITADFTFPGGLTSGIAPQGGIDPKTVEIKVEYRVAGSAGDYTLHSIEQIEAATLQLLRHPVRIILPARGRYEVRFSRLTGNSGSTFQPDLSFLTALRTITYAAPPNVLGHAMVALRIKVSNQLNGVLQIFNLTAEALLPTWSGASFGAPVRTRNPAWAALDVLRGRANKRPLADARLDLDGFKALADDCDEARLGGAARFMFDGVFDARTSVVQAANDILATCRATLTMKDGKWSVVRDRPQSAPVQLLTPRNSWGFRAVKPFVTLPHALKMRFVNEAKEYAQDEIIVFADGKSAETATLYETAELFGVTRAAQAWADGRIMMAEGRLRPETYTLNCDMEHLVARKGSLVTVGHDVPRFGLASGRLKAVTANEGGDATALATDERLTLEAGKSYALKVRRQDGVVLFVTLATVVETIETQSVTPLAPIPAASAPKAGDLFHFGEAARVTADMIVKSVLRSGLDATLELVDAAPAVFDADTGPIPAFDTQSTFPGQGVNLDPPAPIVTEARSDEAAMVEQPGGSLVVAIRLTLEARAGVAVDVDHLEVQFRRVGSGDDWRRQVFQGRPFVAYLVNVEEGASYDLRLRHVTALGRASAWTTIAGHLVIGKSSPPPDVPSAALVGGLLVWTYPDPPRDLAGFRVSWNAGDNRNLAAGAPAHPGLVAAPPFDLAVLPGGTATIFVVAVDTSGNASLNPAVLVKDLGAPATSNIVETIDLEVLGFPGAVTGGALIAGDLKADSLTRFWSNPSALFWSMPGAAFWQTSVYDTLVYECAVALDALWAPADVLLELETSGASPTIEYRRGGQGRFWSDPAAAFWSTPGAGFWSAPEDWQPWPGRLNVGRETLRFRVTVPGGPAQGVILAFRVVVDVADVRETRLDLALPATPSRIAPSKTYRAIKTVRFDLMADGGDAVNVRIIDRDPVLGPLVQPIDAALAGTTATVNATIEGY